MATTTYQELSSNLDKVTLLDVRTVDEIERNGYIPGSHNIPFAEFESAMAMDNSAFKLKYGFDKPVVDQPIVTHCMIGGRAMKAYNLLEEKGFKNVKCYSGSFNDWLTNGGKYLK